MVDPINKGVFDKVEERIRLITVANGYAFDVGKIRRASLSPFKGRDLPAANFWATNLGNTVSQYTIDERSLSLMIEFHDKTRDEPFVDVCDRMAKALVTAMNRSPAEPRPEDEQDQTLGGVADNVIFNGYDYQIGQDQNPFCAILAQFTIIYSSDINTL